MELFHLITINIINFFFKLTWADIYFAGILDYLNYLTKTDLIEKHPNLKRVVDQVNNLEQIKTWLEKRPQTDV